MSSAENSSSRVNHKESHENCFENADFPNNYQISQEQAKLKAAQQEIKQLQEQLSLCKEANKNKALTLQTLNQKISIEKQRKSHVASQSAKSEVKEESSLSGHALILNQLREHFKALKYENGFGHGVGNSHEEDDFDSDEEYEDEVDIDNMTYEELLELGEKIGKVSKGLKQDQISLIKSFDYDKTKLGSKEDECTICQEPFNDQEKCLEFGCSHYFHQECAKQWLQIEKRCPNCKTQIEEK